MGKLVLYRKRNTEITPILIEIDKRKFHIGWGEKREIELPNNRYIIRASGYFGFKGCNEIEIDDKKPTLLVLHQNLPNEISIIAISILTLLFVLSVLTEIIPISVFSVYVILNTFFFFIYSFVIRKRYFKFEIES